METMEIQIVVLGPLVTKGSAAWGCNDRYHSSQEDVRRTVENHPECQCLKDWLDSGTRLALSIEFHLRSQLAKPSDLDNLLSALFNPLVEGACGSRAAGKPIPQTKDALFWQVHASKVVDPEERTVISIQPL